MARQYQTGCMFTNYATNYGMLIAKVKYLIISRWLTAGVSHMAHRSLDSQNKPWNIVGQIH